MSESVGASRYAFISYAPEDSGRVDQLQRVLTAAGIPVWLDKAVLLPGQDRRQQIREAITGAAVVFIACFSKAGLASVRSRQNEEFALAIEEIRIRRPDQIWFIPVRFDECEIPDWEIGGGRTLRSIVPADLFSKGLDQDSARLVAAIGKTLGTRSPAGPVVPASAPQQEADDIEAPDVDLSAGDRQLLIDELGNVYSDISRVGLVLDRVGLLRRNRPGFYGGESPVRLWSEVFIEFDRGIIEHPYRQLLNVVRIEYPANQVFRILARRYLD